MRPLSEDSLFDRAMRFLFGAAVGAGIAFIHNAIHFFVVHTPSLTEYLLVMALGSVVGGVVAVTRGSGRAG